MINIVCTFKIHPAHKYWRAHFIYLILIIFNNVQPVKGPKATQGRDLLKGKSKRFILNGYVGKKTVDPKLEKIKILVAGKTSTWKSIPQKTILGKKLFEWILLLIK